MFITYSFTSTLYVSGGNVGNLFIVTYLIIVILQ